MPFCTYLGISALVPFVLIFCSRIRIICLGEPNETTETYDSARKMKIREGAEGGLCSPLGLGQYTLHIGLPFDPTK